MVYNSEIYFQVSRYFISFTIMQCNVINKTPVAEFKQTDLLAFVLQGQPTEKIMISHVIMDNILAKWLSL